VFFIKGDYQVLELRFDIYFSRLSAVVLKSVIVHCFQW